MKKKKFFFILSIFIVLIAFTIIALLLNRLDIIDLGTTRILLIWHYITIFLTILMWIVLLLNHNYSYSKTLWLYYLLLPGWELSFISFCTRL